MIFYILLIYLTGVIASMSYCVCKKHYMRLYHLVEFAKVSLLSWIFFFLAMYLEVKEWWKEHKYDMLKNY